MTNAEQWSRVKDLFHAALERDAPDRSTFLATACGGDLALRAEIDRLLLAHMQSASFIERSPGSNGGEVRTTMTGRVIGHYEIGRLLGSGGMGQVYAARDVELARDVALKVATLTDEDAQTRLKREAQHASQLSHPHICTIHEIGRCDGRVYIVMEYVEGPLLSDVIPREGLSIESVLRYGIQIADAVAHAHEHGISHRDLKSANVVITPEARAKVLDFGLARRLAAQRLDAISQSRRSLTEEGLIAGTLPYMAPELLRGEPADQRSDIWALGVLLYEMATGERPFTGATGFQVSAAILHEPPASLPARIPSSMQATIRRCLMKDPRERYKHAAEIRSALEAVQAEVLGEAVRTPRLAGPDRSARRSRRAVVGLAGLFLAVVLAAAVGWRWTRGRDESVAVGPSGHPAIAVMDFDVAGATDKDTLWLSRGVPSMLLTGLAQTRGLDVVSARRLQDALRQLGNEDLASLDKSQAADVARRAGAGAVVVGSIFRAGAEMRIDAQLEDLASGRVLIAETVRGTDLFGLVDQLTSRIREGVGFRGTAGIRGVAEVSSASLEAYRMYAEGIDAYNNARLADARRLLEEAVRIDPAFAEGYLHLAFVNHFDGRPAARRSYLEKATAHIDRLSDRQRLLLQAEVARDAGNSAETVRVLDELVAKFPDFEDAYVSALAAYSTITGIAPDREKGLAMFAAGVRALPASSIVRNVYGYALLDAGQFDSAIQQFEESARLAPREPNPYDSLGEVHLAKGMPDKAIEYYSRALTIDPTFVGSHTGRALGLAMLGRYDEAVDEGSPDVLTKAFILSRVGRYRDAAQAIAAGNEEAGTNGNFTGAAGGYLLSSLLAIERRQYARALEEVDAAEKTLAPLPAERKRSLLVLADLFAGMANARSGKLKSARARLESQQRRYRPQIAIENAWHTALDGDVALAEGRLQEAVSVFSSGGPSRKSWLAFEAGFPSVLGNSLPLQDGLARVAIARRDLAGAIQIYGRLLTTGPEQEWSGVLEPRYALELARLMEQSGDHRAARVEYQRFLELWKRADADLPELSEARRAVERLRAGRTATDGGKEQR